MHHSEVRSHEPDLLDVGHGVDQQGIALRRLAELQKEKAEGVLPLHTESDDSSRSDRTKIALVHAEDRRAQRRNLLLVLGQEVPQAEIAWGACLDHLHSRLAMFFPG
jgi:hypothetical protein